MSIRRKITTLLIIMSLIIMSVAPVYADSTVKELQAIKQPTGVLNEITKFQLNVTKKTIDIGESFTFGYSYGYSGKNNNTTITWSSSNKKVATISNGKVTGKSTGKAVITAKMGNKVAKCEVTVSAPKYVSTADCYTIINTYRKSAKIGTLKKDANLEKLAKIRVKEMAEYNKFSHTRPNGKSGLTLITGNKHKGENIAMGQKTCKDVMKAWYNSKGHKDNMLRKQFTKVGFAAYKYAGRIYWCTLFSN